MVLCNCKKTSKPNDTVDDSVTSMSSTSMIIVGGNQNQLARIILVNIITKFTAGGKEVTLAGRVLKFNGSYSTELDNTINGALFDSQSADLPENYSFNSYFENKIKLAPGYVSSTDVAADKLTAFLQNGSAQLTASLFQKNLNRVKDMLLSMIATGAYAQSNLKVNDQETDNIDKKFMAGAAGMAMCAPGKSCYTKIAKMAYEVGKLWNYVADKVSKADDKNNSYSADDLNKDLNQPPPNQDANGNNQNNTPSKGNGGAYGEPHFTTIDGLYYDFQGYGEFIDLKSTADNFEIQVRQEEVPAYSGRQVTATTGMAINTNNDVICMFLDEFYINKAEHAYSNDTWNLTGGGSVSYHDGTISVTTPNQDVIKVSIFQNIYLDYNISLNSNRQNKIEGLLGNYDGISQNDTQIKNGKVVNPYNFSDMYPAYADSWRVVNSLFVYPSGYTTQNYTKTDYPKSASQLTAAARAQAESTCRSLGVTDEPYLSGCIIDVGLSGSSAYALSAIKAAQSKYQISQFTIASFSSFDQLDLVPQGNAQLINGDLYLTKNEGYQVGAAFKKYKVDISKGFQVDFDFQISQPGGSADTRNRIGGDGFAFIMQDYSTLNTPLPSGEGLGYAGLPRSVAIEFDTYNNGSNENADDISLNTQGINNNSVNDSQSLIKAQTHPLPILNNGIMHHAVIKYTNTSTTNFKIEVFLDGNTTPYLSADNINIQQLTGSLTTGVFMGFTASTAGAYENHIIHAWSLKTN